MGDVQTHQSRWGDRRRGLGVPGLASDLGFRRRGLRDVLDHGTETTDGELTVAAAVVLLIVGLALLLAGRMQSAVALVSLGMAGYAAIDLATDFSDTPGYQAWLMVAVVAVTIVAGIVGYLAIWFLLAFLRRYSTAIFIIYRIILGGLLLGLLWKGQGREVRRAGCKQSRG